MAGDTQGDFRLADWLIQPALGRVSRAGSEASLRPREMDLLVYLSQRAGEVVRTDDIMSDVWQGVEVTNDSLYFSISQLRKALDDGSGASIIETIPKRGYRIVAGVEAIEPNETSNLSGENAISQSPTDPGSVGTIGAGQGRLHGLRVGVAAVLVAIVGVLWFGIDDQAPPPREEPVVLAPLDAEPGSIAVMPFIDLTPETDYTYFSDGITEEILNRLTRVPGLRVAARTSSFTFKDSDLGVAEIARALGVANLLEGSVRKEGERVRISVQLIDATSGFQLWSESFEHTLTSVFDVQNKISRKVAEALKVTLTSSNGEGGGKSTAVASPYVLDEYLLGLEALRVMSFGSLRSAVDHFENVLEADPSFDNARIQLAMAKIQLINTGAASDMSLIADADALVSKVLDGNPDDGDAHRVLGMVRKWQKRWPEAVAQFERALEIAPSDSESMEHLAHSFAGAGRLEDWRRMLDRAMRVDPFSVRILQSVANVNRMFGDIAAAHDTIGRAIKLRPENPNLWWVLGQIQAAEEGKLADGLESFLTSAESDPSDYEIAAYVAATYASLEMQAPAAHWLDRSDRLGPDDAFTTWALRAAFEQIDGQGDAAVDSAGSGFRDRGYRFWSHPLLTAPLLNVLVSEADGPDGAEAVARLLLDNVPEPANLAGDSQPGELGSRSALTKDDMPRLWFIAIAAAYKRSGNLTGAQEALEVLQGVRIDDVRAVRNKLRGIDFLLEAEIRAIEGDLDGAFEMLDAALDRGYVFLWQIRYANNAAFADLRADARWTGVMERINNKIAAERQLVSDSVTASLRGD